ncbi:DUF2339 domain-containing protein [Ostreiculturibacter nitratireducens]|uniref:DUF2339 domain-containing protein n=1 Tax=Ostreiculturibacter nitratireducens TaxID=3075226 RepID=UPI0031B60F07
MEGLLVLIGLAVLAVPVAVVALIVGQVRLRARMEALEAQVAKLRKSAAPGEERAALPWDRPKAEEAPKPAEVTEVAAPEEAEMAAEAVVEEEPVSGLEQVSGPREPEAPEEFARPPEEGPIVVRSDRALAFGRWLKENWVFTVSAISLALAGIFLVQYGVEKGYLPPPARVLLALGFGAVLIIAGEVIRRRWGDTEQAATAYLPSTFSGAGLVSMFAAILAARQLYDLIGAGTALTGLGLIAALAIVLGWFYGPFLAAFGLLGAAVSPFIVGGEAETPYWMYIYYAVLAFIGLSVDAVRRWAWVSVLALILGFGGTWVTWTGIGGGGWHALTLTVLALMAIAVPPLNLIPRHQGRMLSEAFFKPEGGWPEFPTRLAGGAVAVSSAALLMQQTMTAEESILVFLCLAALALALTLWADGARALSDLAILPAGAFLARLWQEGMGRGPLSRDYVWQAIDLRPPETSAPATASLLLAIAALVSLAAAWRSFGEREYRAHWGAGAALVAPVAAVILELFWVPGAVMGDYPWALHVIALAAVMVVLAERFARADGEDHRRAAYATLSALSLIALALFLVTTKGALTLALSALLVVAAALDRRFRLPEMGIFIQAGVVTLGWRLVVDPGIGWALDAVLWETWASFGGAIAAMAAALWLLKGRVRTGARVFLESGLAGSAALFANVLITRWIENWTGLLDMFQHWALSLQAMPWIVVMLVHLYRLQLDGAMRIVRGILAAVAALLALAPLTLAVLPANPLLSGDYVDGPLVLDTLAVAYALPGLMLILPLAQMPHVRRWIRRMLTGAGVGLLALYGGLEIRRFWRGDLLSVQGTTQAELYSYTLAMMAVGSALLYQAIARRSRGLRRLAMTVIALTIGKVFLIDASGLTGLTRVFSFLLLGLALAGLAWLNRWAAGRQAKGEE